ncbi:MAG TPA: CDP-diacylglycerol--serine O-phosphatidyltransferase [Thermoanaerobaculia bacterium]|jgi:CDP-diacylglycerol--serine O-phosphatidyltransferase|nr:CDP-diacylglycerol--serine O-phosphatidyltransferase [Thermoanaerobaculia bacterium]
MSDDASLATQPAAPVSRRGARLRRGAYLLPSLFTIGNIVMGFYAVISGLRGEFGKAAALVFIAGVLDAFDGRIARAFGTESDFGKEYDSLADVLTFGAAPALLTYLWGIEALSPRDAWLLPMFYLVCTATRLARFNVQHKIVDVRYFVGLPAPAAAGAICSILFFVPDLNPEYQRPLQWITAVALVVIGLLMVSTFRYRSFKAVGKGKRWSYRAVVPIAAIVLTIFYLPRATFLAIAILYTSSGPLASLTGRLSPRRDTPPEEAAPPSAPGDSGGHPAA